MKKLFENSYIYIEKESSEIPWAKIFTKQNCKELSDCDETTRMVLFDTVLAVEKCMLEFYNPKKINIALFGNYLPKLHVHVMARFENDSYFPEPMWGKKQRDGILNLPDFNDFQKLLEKRLKK